MADMDTTSSAPLASGDRVIIANPARHSHGEIDTVWHITATGIVVTVCDGYYRADELTRA